MAVVGPSRGGARGSMSVMQGAGQAVVTGAQSYYHPPPPSQDLQPDRPIGYGAFGVVW